MLSTTEGVQDYGTISGFSLLTRISASYQGFFFVGLKPLGRAHRAAGDRACHCGSSEQGAGGAVCRRPWPLRSCRGHSGTRQCRGVLVLAPGNRSGGSVDFLDQNVAEVPRRLPPASGARGGRGPVFPLLAPQIYADVDRDKVLKQGVAVADVYANLQTYHRWSVREPVQPLRPAVARPYLQAEGEDRQSVQDIRDYYVRNTNGTMVPLSALVQHA